MAYSVTRNPTAADGGTGGLAGQMWNSPTSIFISDNSHASHGGYYQGGNNSKPLKATGFAFNIPIGALILGIEVNVEKRASDNNYAEYSTDSYIYLVKNGVQEVLMNTEDLPTPEERIAVLQAQNDVVSQTLDTILTEILPMMMGI